MAPRRAIVTTAAILAVGALLSVGIATMRQIDQLNEDSILVSHTQEVIGRVERLVVLVVTAESGVRGYAVSGDERSLAAYTTAEGAIPSELRELDAVIYENPPQAARSRELAAAIAAVMANLGRQIDLRQARANSESRVDTAVTGAKLMEAARTLAETMTEAEQALLQERRRRLASGIGSARRTALASAIGAVSLLLLTGLQIGAELRKRRLAEAAVRTAYEDVEDIVKARTQELETAVDSLRISEDQFRVVAELSPVYLFRTDEGGGIEFVSPSFYDFSGLAPENARGFGWTHAVDPADRERLLTDWQSAIAGRRPFETECRFRSKEGRSRWFRVRAVPRPLADNARPSWVGAAVDIHELKDALATRAVALSKAQDAQRESEAANQLKDDFLATVSHELRTPLNAIVGWAHVLTLANVTDPDRQRAIEAIQRNAKVQTRLVEDLLDISNMMRGRLKFVVSSVDLRATVREAVETVTPAARARGVALHAHLGGESVVIDGDSSRLQQIAWNLLSNAVKFTVRGGRVDVTVDRVDGRARLRVDDTGEGIDSAFLPHVFEAFRQGPSTAMRVGLGLGLAIVRRIVELHGGTITAQSEGQGRGASFAVTFPLHLGAPIANVQTGRAQPRQLQGVSALVVEDDEDSAAALAAVLRLRGCRVGIARTAAECLRLLRDEHFDVLLIDVGLPDDDGYSLLRRARALPGASAWPAVALTAFAGESDRGRALAAGFVAHIGKPFDPDIVVHEIMSAVRT